MNYKRIDDNSMHEGPVRIFGLFSGGASSLRAMLKDPNREDLYNLVGSLTNKPEVSGIGHMRSAEIPVQVFDYRDFCRIGSREKYFEELIKMLEPYKLDIIALSGFMLLIPTFFLKEYWNRILNVHPADLAIMTGAGVERLYVGNLLPSEVAKLMRDNQLQRKFVGDNAVYDAIKAGEECTLSTIHMLNEPDVVDGGSILVQSKRFLVDIPSSMSVEEYSDELQEEMKWKGDGPAYLKTLEFLALGRLGISEDGITVFLDGRPLPYRGYQLED